MTNHALPNFLPNLPISTVFDENDEIEESTLDDEQVEEGWEDEEEAAEVVAVVVVTAPIDPSSVEVRLTAYWISHALGH